MMRQQNLIRAAACAILLGAGSSEAGTFLVPVPLEPGNTGVFPDSAMGRCAAAFVAMVNDGKGDAVRRFEQTWASKTRAAQKSMDERVSGIAKLHTDWGTLTPTRCTARDGGLVLEATGSAHVRLSMEFNADSAEPGKLGTIMIRAEQGTPSSAILAKDRDLVVRAAANVLATNYVFPEVGNTMSDAIISNLDKGGYDGLDDDVALADRLTADLRAISHDKHLRVAVAPAESGRHASPLPEGDDARRDNYAFRSVEVLPGNIGYLKFDLFLDSPEAMKVATAAMGFLHNCDAIIFDLRSNGGGSPEMIRFLTSYFVGPHTHLNSMVDRDGKIVEEFWTLDRVPGERLREDIPVFVLTSPRTFSGAEEFSYNLKNLKQATIVGQTTGGGAHPVRFERLNDRFVIGVPYMRAQNPISKTNWEGVGVEPDVKVEPAAALEKAQELAREAIKATSPKGG